MTYNLFLTGTLRGLFSGIKLRLCDSLVANLIDLGELKIENIYLSSCHLQTAQRSVADNYSGSPRGRTIYKRSCDDRAEQGRELHLGHLKPASVLQW